MSVAERGRSDWGGTHHRTGILVHVNGRLEGPICYSGFQLIYEGLGHALLRFVRHEAKHPDLKLRCSWTIPDNPGDIPR